MVSDTGLDLDITYLKFCVGISQQLHKSKANLISRVLFEIRTAPELGLGLGLGASKNPLLRKLATAIVFPVRISNKIQYLFTQFLTNYNKTLFK